MLKVDGEGSVWLHRETGRRYLVPSWLVSAGVWIVVLDAWLAEWRYQLPAWQTLAIWIGAAALLALGIAGTWLDMHLPSAG